MDLVTPGIGLIFWMLVSFIVVLLILKKYAWKPILKSLKNRENSIEEALQSAEEAKKEMAQLKADNEKVLQEARYERDNILKDARTVKDKIIKEAKQQATDEANKIMQNTLEQIEYQKLLALNEIKNQVAGISIEIAEKLLRKELSETSKQQEYIEILLKEFKVN
ncbi:MAG: F0F1 ATP synthase subunit B [Bacteroidia bacterium]|nr:F0F1 ATP synthase subunit B [Bacteroidia bacterium]